MLMQTRESLAIFVFVLLQHYIGIATASILEPGFSRTAILVDPFTEYLSGHCKEYCAARDIRVVEVVSGFTAGALEAKGVSIPAKFLAPTAGFESSWAEEFAIDVQNCPPDVICVVAESDAGVPTAERIAVALNLPGNGISPQLRNKFMTNERARSVGLKVVEQALVSKWDDAHSFVEDLLRKSPYGACVIKPYRGVASDGVYLCRTIQEAKFAFESLHGQPQFGGGSNDAVLIQEYVAGTEYAVDTVARDGEIKVVALWRYRKLPFNGAPFVYQCSELVPCNGEEERAVCDYCVDILRAQGLKWGPTHTEIMASKDGPRLIEVNARFHAQHFQPIARACLGYDAIESTMDAYFDPGMMLLYVHYAYVCFTLISCIILSCFFLR